MERIRFRFPEREDDYKSHLPAFDPERTLCGLVFDGVCASEAYPLQEFVPSRRRSDCVDCFNIWLHCQQIKRTDFTEDSPNGFGINIRNGQIDHVSVRQTDGYCMSESGSSEHPLDQTRYTVMQFTGLLDKNGVEIYEGDLVKHPVTHNRQRRVVGEIAWGSWSWGIKTPVFHAFDPATARESEVIGNIYSNPELLDTKAEAA